MRPRTVGGGFARLYRRATLIAMALTVVLFIGHYLLPERRLMLWPSEQNKTELYGFADREHGKSAYWLKQDANHWLCDYKSSNAYGCGWWMHLIPSGSSGVAFSKFDALEIALDYRGPASRLRIFLRNDNPAYTTPDDGNSSKVMTMSVPAAEAAKPILVSMDEFSVASWWLHERKVNRQWAHPELDAVTALGVDLIEPGKHEVRIDHISLVGRWVKTETLLIAFLSFWMSVFLLEGLVRFFRLYRTAQRNREEIQNMEEKQRILAEENKQLETVANTDALTGIYNRAGLQCRINALLRQHGTLAGLRLMLLDIDHFKQLNDHYGHDMGDKVLKTFASLLAMNLRQDDIFARLGGEEFVVVSSRTQSTDGPHAFAEKLRQLALYCTFNGDSQLHISVSIGVSIVAEGEDFASALRRADKALYKAKQSGRNRVEYEAQS